MCRVVPKPRATAAPQEKNRDRRGSRSSFTESSTGEREGRGEEREERREEEADTSESGVAETFCFILFSVCCVGPVLAGWREGGREGEWWWGGGY